MYCTNASILCNAIDLSIAALKFEQTQTSLIVVFAKKSQTH